jgi:CMP/dCMP kinase
MKSRIITIGGKLGAGKSSTAKALAERLGYSHFSSGDFMRSLANERGITLQELGLLAETDSTIDHAIDEKVREAGLYDHRIIDSRLAFHFIPHAFKVYLELPSDIAAKRIFHDRALNPNRISEDTAETIPEIKQSIETRLESEKKRYQELYSIDHTDHSSFDLVIDTSTHSLPEVVKKILDTYDAWLAREE